MKLKASVIEQALVEVLASKTKTYVGCLYGVVKNKFVREDIVEAYIRTWSGFLQKHPGQPNEGYTQLIANFKEYLRQENLLEEDTGLAHSQQADQGYKEDVFDFSDWDAIRRATGF